MSWNNSRRVFNEEQEEEQIVFTEEDFFVKKDEEYKNQIKWIIPNAQKNCMEPIHLLLEKVERPVRTTPMREKSLAIS